MPIRKENQTGTETPKKLKEKLTTLAGSYLSSTLQEKKIKAEKEKLKPEIKNILCTPGVYELNGKHKEAILPAGDGKTNILVQLQLAESITTVDDIVGRIKKKLGEKASTYITTVEVLHSNALETMFNSGLITEQDMLDWTVTKEQERLIIKIADNKKD